MDPGSILTCITDMSYHNAKLIHKEGNLDSLALLTAVTVQSAISLELVVSFCMLQKVVSYHWGCLFFDGPVVNNTPMQPSMCLFGTCALSSC